MSDWNVAKKGRRRKKKPSEKPVFQPTANSFLNPNNQRIGMPSMAPPRHLPTNIVIPLESTEFQREPKAQTAPAVALNTWKAPPPPKQKPQFNRQQSAPGLSPVPPAPPPSKPVMSPQFGTPKPPPSTKPVKTPRFGVPSMAPPRHLPTNIVPVSDSIVLPRTPSSHALPMMSPAPLSPYGTPKTQATDYTVGSSFNLIPPPGDRTGLPNENRQVSNTSAGRRRRRRKKKRLNKFNSREIQREPVNDVVFTPKAAPLPPLKPKQNMSNLKNKRGRANSKNISDAFYGIASKEPNDIRFDNAMEKMKMKMERKKSQQELFAEPKATPRSREKSRQIQSKLQTQFGFFQNKFNHKEKVPRKRRGQNRKGQPIPTLPPRRQQMPEGPSGIAGLF